MTFHGPRLSVSQAGSGVGYSSSAFSSAVPWLDGVSTSFSPPPRAGPPITQTPILPPSINTRSSLTPLWVEERPMAIPITILDCDLLLYGRGHRVLDRCRLDDVSDEYLVSTYGFPRSYMDYLVELLGSNLSRPTQRSRAISPETQIMAALGFYTSGSFQTRMGDTIGISQASMSRCVTNVTEALVEKASQFIHFPREEKSIQQLKDDFYGLAGVPGVLGVVDCIHVTIKAPNAEDMSYVNRRGLHSLNCILACDTQGVLLWTETHRPGSMQDNAVLHQSDLSCLFETDLHKEGWLIGDNSFLLRPWLMTPVQMAGSSPEYRYNMAHTATHSVMERTQRSLKIRFRCLDGSKATLQYSPEKASQIVLACCILHNIALQHGMDIWNESGTAALEQEEDCGHVESVESEAYRMRQELILTHFS
ncbi:putative nuclease HARBI1 [Pelodytes ibericus]